MFTGLIEKTGELVSLEKRAAGAMVTVRYEPWADDPMSTGESVSVQGVCLTVADCGQAGIFRSDVLAETLATTNLGQKQSGSLLNLERATRQGDRLGGHITSGHIDGVGYVEKLSRKHDDHLLRVRCEKSIATGIVRRGSIAIDGISLTVTNLANEWFEVSIIPHTWRHTSLLERKIGDTVNLETDILGKYVARHLASREEKQPLTLDDLARAGFD